MKIERPWAGQGDNWEVMVPDAEDWAAALERMPKPSQEERLASMQRYLMARYGGLPAASG